ncbi:DUF2059 domain-containing protein [Spirosoma fluminis]
MRQFFAFLCLALISFHASAQSAPTKQDDIRQLMTMMGTTSLMEQSMSRFVETFKKANTGLPESFWTGVEKEANYQDLINRLIPVYEKHYTHDEIKELLAFYKSPLGQKSIRELPAIMQESASIGREWGEQLGRRIADRIQAEKSPPKN